MLSLKQKKKNLISKIKDYNAKIYTINHQLQVEEQLFEPKFDARLEDPESQFNFEESVSEETATKEKEETLLHKKRADFQQFVKLKPRAAYKIRLSPLEEEQEKIKRLTLEFKKQKLLEEIKQDVESFDATIETCIREKRVLDRDL